MDLSKRTKVLLGIGTIWPPIYIVIFMIAIFSIIALAPGPGEPATNPIFPIGFVIIFIAHILTIVLSLGLTVFYIIHAIKNAKLCNDMKAVWAVLFFFVGMFAQPVYWYTQIWKTPADGVGMLPSSDAHSETQSQDSRRPNYAPPTEPPDWR